jgi:hypothetical protein
VAALLVTPINSATGFLTEEIHRAFTIEVVMSAGALQSVNVCFWHFSDITCALTNVRYRG